MSWRTFTDQLGSQVKVSFPQRIISIVPSQTELLYDLGLDEKVIGITKFCVHPATWLKAKTIVGGTKNLRFDVIESLNPDLIIGNKEENNQDDITRLRLKYPVWMSDIVSLKDSVNMIRQVGELTNTGVQAEVIQTEIKNAFSSITKLPPVRALYLIWHKPWMGVAADTFIHELMTIAGLKNCLSDQKRYPELTHQTIAELNPELILLSSEPYPFQDKHVLEFQQVFPGTKILLVDGEMFSWYGSRLRKFPDYIQSLTSLL